MSNETYSPAFAAASFPMATQGQKYMSAAARYNAQAFKAVMRYQIETLGFLKRRYEQDMKLVDDLLAAEETNDAFDVLATFWQNAAAEYSAEAGRIAQIGSRIASDAAGQVRREAETAVSDMAAQTVA